MQLLNRYHKHDLIISDLDLYIHIYVSINTRKYAPTPFANLFLKVAVVIFLSSARIHKEFTIDLKFFEYLLNELTIAFFLLIFSDIDV